ncbi:MAG TPA: hypothetical protein VM008_18300 [Phycisphaerae bacterium]|nr:hypothetical protein [Phycisphaerae bacterium]
MLCRLLPAFLSFALLTPLARAETHFLTFGGGPSPDYNQISLEKNIQYLQHVLVDLGLAKVPNDIYFADGGSSFHVVKYLAPDDPANDFADEISDLAMHSGGLEDRYAPVTLHPLNGPSTHDALATWFSTTGKSLHAGDRLVFYFTGHGGADSSRLGVQRNTTMEMWDSPAFTVREFLQQLDKLDPAVAVTLIMVQCHSGGFADAIYTDGDYRQGLARQPRCGFFSTTAPRLAAGCTPEMNEEAYQDFSTHFFAALSGKTRIGKAVEKPDYDHKGYTSFTDAFVYALLNDDTIDIPISTSDQLLRDFSHFRTREETTDILENNAPYADVLAAASPAQRAALEGLSVQLALTGNDRLPKALAMARDLQSERNALTRSRRATDNAFNNARERLHDALAHHFPELGIPNHPDAAKIMATQHDAILALLNSQKDYQVYHDAEKKRDDLDEQEDALERKWVTTQRFLERARTVILAANLPKVAKPDIVAAYQALIARESETFSK